MSTIQNAAFIQKYALPQCRAELIEAIRPGILCTAISGAESTKNGKSKLGGTPDLPADIAWPVHEKSGQPFTFLGQIRLEDIHHICPEAALPVKGLLYFFLNINSVGEGIVLFAPDATHLQKANVPEAFYPKKKSFWANVFSRKDPVLLLKECPIQMQANVLIPYEPGFFFDQLHQKHGIKSSFLPETPAEIEPDGPRHQLLGHYVPIQGGYLEAECIGMREPWEQLSTQQIQEALQWKLLFQMDSDPELEFNWCDSGRIYFLIHENDLAQGNFSKVQVIGDSF